MTDLTAKWKAGKIESLGELIKQIEEVDNRRALSDEYLIERNNAPRSEYAPAEEWGYGIVWAMSDYVLPYLKELQALKAENAKLKELLKDIKLFFEECNPHDFTIVADNMDIYLTHINAALGEIQASPVDNIKIQESEE